MGQRGSGVDISAIIGIETTTYCNRDCHWCANYRLEPTDMSDFIFDKSLEVLGKLPPGRIAMNGCGEPLMDVKIIEHVSAVSSIGYEPIMYSNGDLVCDEIMSDLGRAGLREIWISQHDNVDEKLKIPPKYGIIAEKAYSPAIGGHTHDFAGQIMWENEIDKVCNPLLKGWFYINVDGYITQCCLDYAAKHPVGHVIEGIEDIISKETPLCAKCTGSP